MAVARVYRSDRRTEQSRRTRRRILEAAAAEFLVHGYAATTIRAVAQRAGVSVPLVEATFGTKARLLKATVDVGIAGDDEPVAMLDRDWAGAALRARSVLEFLTVVAGVLGPAQTRSAGLVLAALEGSRHSPELAEVSAELVRQRAGTAAWIVEALGRLAPRPPGLSEAEAVETLWVLMDPAVFDRLTRQRGWTGPQYQEWFARSAARLLAAEPTNQAPTEEVSS